MNNNLDIEELVSRLKAALSGKNQAHELEFLDNNETLVRYLKSREWDVEAAEKMLLRTLAWRAESQPQKIQCNYCRTNPGAHTLRQIGFDEAKRPVIYASFFPAKESQKNITEEVLTHLIYVMENAVKSMPVGVNQWVFIIDCAGMTPSGCHPRLGYTCAQMMSNHYPERLGLAICIRPGSVFKVAWQAMKPFLPPATARKVCIVSTKSKLQSTLDKYFSPTMTEWIMNEYKSNRRSPASARYRPFWMPYFNEDGTLIHDPRGEQSYVEQWIKVWHPSGHQPHPNIIDYMNGKLQESFSLSNIVVENGEGEEDDSELADVDEDTARRLLDSLPTEFQIPKDAEKLG